MRNLWSRGAGSAAAAVLLGLLGLVSLLPLLAIGAATCVAAIPVLAPFGLHLDLLTPAGPGCPEHSFLPGANFGPTVQFVVLLFTTTAAAGALHLLLAVGVGWWLLRAVGAAHAWVRAHLAPAAPRVPVLGLRRPVVLAPVVVGGGSGRYQPSQRRGPPLTD